MIVRSTANVPSSTRVTVHVPNVSMVDLTATSYRDCRRSEFYMSLLLPLSLMLTLWPPLVWQRPEHLGLKPPL